MTLISPALGKKPNISVISAKASYKEETDGEMITSNKTKQAKKGRIFLNRLV